MQWGDHVRTWNQLVNHHRLWCSGETMCVTRNQLVNHHRLWCSGETMWGRGTSLLITADCDAVEAMCVTRNQLTNNRRLWCSADSAVISKLTADHAWRGTSLLITIDCDEDCMLPQRAVHVTGYQCGSGSLGRCLCWMHIMLQLLMCVIWNYSVDKQIVFLKVFLCYYMCVLTLEFFNVCWQKFTRRKTLRAATAWSSVSMKFVVTFS